MTPTTSVTLVSEGERMARREWQNPSVLERNSAAGPVWYIRYREKKLTADNGQMTVRRVEKWETLGSCAKMSKHQAERAAAKILQRVNAQVFTLQSQLPWTEFVRLFDVNHIEGLAVPTQNNYRTIIRAHLTPALKNYTLAQIGPLQLQGVIKGLESTTARSTRVTIRNLLSTMFKCAVKWRLVDSNPVGGVTPGGGARQVRGCVIPTLNQVRELMALCAPEIALLIETLVLTGMRISEAAGLVVSDLDFDAGAIHVQRRFCRGDTGDTKRPSSVRDLPMGNAEDALLAHTQGKAPDDYVFTHEGLPIMDCVLLSRYVTPRMEKLGIKFPGFGWHTFRRLHLSLMRKQGLTLFDLTRQAGHTDVRTTQRYIADDLEERARAVRALPFMIKRA
jgi:integrase